jgi:predicted  nucleic acid-binding Zn-ribbon protein
LVNFSSAQLNIAHSSLDEVAKYAQTRLDRARASFKTGLQDAKELQKELSELESRVRDLKDKGRERWPVEYYTARDEIDG